MTTLPGRAPHSTQITGTTLASPHATYINSGLATNQDFSRHHTCRIIFILMSLAHFTCALPPILSSGDSLDGTDPASSSYQSTLYLSPILRQSEGTILCYHLSPLNVGANVLFVASLVLFLSCPTFINVILTTSSLGPHHQRHMDRRQCESGKEN